MALATIDREIGKTQKGLVGVISLTENGHP
jgi:hypothetical protein